MEKGGSDGEEGKGRGKGIDGCIMWGREREWGGWIALGGMGMIGMLRYGLWRLYGAGWALFHRNLRMYYTR